MAPHFIAGTALVLLACLWARLGTRIWRFDLLRKIKRLAESHKKLAAILLLSLATSQALAADSRLASLDKFIALLAPHAQSYPPKFDSVAQKTAMVKGLKDVLGGMDSAPERARADKEFLFRYAFLNSMGHNLDLEGSSAKAMNGYEALLKLDPDDKRANYYFGTFLVGTKLIATSVPYLQKAIKLGEADAHYPLGFAYLSQERNQDALAEFKKYLEYDPGNQVAKQMVEKIESGRTDLKFNYSE
jgi:tetratricopeptide (TPR) repeat protein